MTVHEITAQIGGLHCSNGRLPVSDDALPDVNRGQMNPNALDQLPAKKKARDKLPQTLAWIAPFRDLPAVATAMPALLRLTPEEQLRRDPARRPRIKRHLVEIEAEATRLQRLAEQPEYAAMIADPQHVDMVRRRQAVDSGFRTMSSERGWYLVFPDDLQGDERATFDRATLDYRLTIDHLATEEAQLRTKYGVKPVAWRVSATWQGPEPRHDVKTLPQIEYYLITALYLPRRAVDRQSAAILGRINVAVRNAEIALDELGEADHRTSGRPLGDMRTFDVALDAALWLLAWIRRRLRDKRPQESEATGLPLVDPLRLTAPPKLRYDDIDRTLYCDESRIHQFTARAKVLQPLLSSLQAADWKPVTVWLAASSLHDAKGPLIEILESAGLVANITVETAGQSSSRVSLAIARRAVGD